MQGGPQQEAPRPETTGEPAPERGTTGRPESGAPRERPESPAPRERLGTAQEWNVSSLERTRRGPPTVSLEEYVRGRGTADLPTEAPLSRGEREMLKQGPAAEVRIDVDAIARQALEAVEKRSRREPAQHALPERADTWRSDAVAARIRETKPDSFRYDIEPGLLDPREVIEVLEAELPGDWEMVNSSGHCSHFSAHMPSRPQEQGLGRSTGLEELPGFEQCGLEATTVCSGGDVALWRRGGRDLDLSVPRLAGPMAEEAQRCVFGCTRDEDGPGETLETAEGGVVERLGPRPTLHQACKRPSVGQGGGDPDRLLQPVGQLAGLLGPLRLEDGHEIGHPLQLVADRGDLIGHRRPLARPVQR